MEQTENKKIKITIGEFKKMLQEAAEEFEQDSLQNHETVSSFKRDLLGLIDSNRSMLSNPQLMQTMELLMDLVFTNLSKIKSSSGNMNHFDRVLLKLRMAYKEALKQSEDQKSDTSLSDLTDMSTKESMYEETALPPPANKQQLLKQTKDNLVAALNSIPVTSKNIDGLNTFLTVVVGGLNEAKALLATLPENASDKQKSAFVLTVVRKMLTKIPNLG